MTGLLCSHEAFSGFMHVRPFLRAQRIIIRRLSRCAHHHSLSFTLHASSFAVFPGIHTFVRVGLLFLGDFYISLNHIFTGNLFFDLLR